jgi:dephospho-CoA kinase
MKVAICGKMCSGKSTLANYIMRTFPGHQKYSFAKRVKELCVELFNMEGKNRTLLINFANKMRDIDSNVWINQVLKETKGKENCIIDDVRYQNEVDALIQDGWIFIQLHISYELQKERIMKIYPDNFQDHLDSINHISEKNNFIFPHGFPHLTLNMREEDEKKILHEINLLFLKNK